jgi:4-carboxymuconolactone decarboxylase
MPNFLTEMCFGNFYTRNGLELRQRELLAFCALVALGGADVQVRAHAAGNLKVGNSKETLIAAMIQCFPYVGFPRALDAIRALDALDEP